MLSAFKINLNHVCPFYWMSLLSPGIKYAENKIPASASMVLNTALLLSPWSHQRLLGPNPLPRPQPSCLCRPSSVQTWVGVTAMPSRGPAALSQGYPPSLLPRGPGCYSPQTTCHSLLPKPQSPPQKPPCSVPLPLPKGLSAGSLRTDPFLHPSQMKLSLSLFIHFWRKP